MSLYIASLNSGSNGNCYYIGNQYEAVLVDAGISCREIDKRMTRLGLNMKNVKAVFVSHEHIDHIKGLPILLKKYSLPLHISKATYSRCGFTVDGGQIISFKDSETVRVGSLSIVPFKKYHDAVDPFSFTISSDGVTVGVITDIGRACSNVIKHFKQCHAAFLESNYDEEMLQNGGYPFHLKKRISGGRGHISNREALELFLQHKPTFMSHLLLSHLSHNNNRPDLVSELFMKHAGEVEVVIASRYEETAVYHVKGGATEHPVKENVAVISVKPTQMSFAF